MPSKTIVPIALLFAAALAQAEPLYFYAQKDKIGVKTVSGRVVIAPVKVTLPDAHHYAEAKRPIRGHTIEICFSEHFNENRDDAIAADVGDVFSRTGQYLYSPIEYDNGCDYWQEGMRRYVEKGRVGFVRRDGSRATPAPAALYGSPESIRAETARILESYGKGSGHVFNLGHGISQFADPEHAKVLVDAVHELSRPYHQA